MTARICQQVLLPVSEWRAICGATSMAAGTKLLVPASAAVPPPRGTAAALAGTGRAAPSVGGDFAYLSFTIGMTFQVSAPAGLPGDHPGGRYGDGGRRPCAARRDQQGRPGTGDLDLARPGQARP